MTYREIHRYITTQLQGLYALEEASAMAYRLISFFYKKEKIDIALSKDNNVDIHLVQDVLNQLCEGKPLQYVTGEAYFYDLVFYVNENVLIPRSETEELIDLIINKTTIASPQILDIGTGSGCIPIALKKNIKGAYVYSCDISEQALVVAKENARRNDTPISFFKCDILQIDHLERGYDIIVSNPPYVTESDKKQMHKNVLDYEPWQALFVADDKALIFYSKIADLAWQHLNKGGKLYFEINENYGEATKEMLIHRGFSEVEILKDLFGKDRMSSCVKL